MKNNHLHILPLPDKIELTRHFDILSDTVRMEIVEIFDNCRLCWAASTYGQRFPVNLSVYQTADYLVIPALGSLCAGYLMFVSRNHRGSVATLTVDDLWELENQLSDLSRLLHSRLVPSLKWMIFEHGTTVEFGLKACCIDHLHLHVVPLYFDLEDMLTRLLNCSGKRIESLIDLPTRLNSRRGNYILVRALDVDYYSVFEPPSYSSQFVRQVIARQMQVREQWNWIYHPMEGNVLATLRAFRTSGASSRVIYLAYATEELSKHVVNASIQRLTEALSVSFPEVQVMHVFELVPEEIVSNFRLSGHQLEGFLRETELRYITSCDIIIADLTVPEMLNPSLVQKIAFASSCDVPVIAIGKANEYLGKLWKLGLLNRLVANIPTLLKAVQDLMPMWTRPQTVLELYNPW